LAGALLRAFGMRTRAPLLLPLVAAMSACGPLSGFSLVEDPAPLTSGSSDPLFTLAFNAGTFNTGLLAFSVVQPGRPETRIRCRDIGPTTGEDFVFACSEPDENLFDEASVGVPVQVSLVAVRPGNRQRIDHRLNDLVWVPSN
jgi:hypothetical protein